LLAFSQATIGHRADQYQSRTRHERQPTNPEVR